MSLVDYAAAARKRVPAWQGVAWQPGLWLAWAVIVIAIFAAVAPGLLTHYSPIEGIAGAQRLALRPATGSAPISLAAMFTPVLYMVRPTP